MQISFFLRALVYDLHFACASAVKKQSFLCGGYGNRRSKAFIKASKLLTLNSRCVVTQTTAGSHPLLHGQLILSDAV